VTTLPQDDERLRAIDEFRRSGEALVARMAEYLESVATRPVSTPRPPREIAARFAEPLPRAGRPAEEVWAETWERVVDSSIHLAHPMYMGHQVAPPLPQAVLADALASLLNQSVAVWEMSPAGTFVEAQVVRWMVELLGYPAGADGTLVSGGSAANLTALLAAQAARFPGSWNDGVAGVRGLDRAVVLVSPQAHYSIERAAGVMGLGGGSVLAVAQRGEAMDPDGLRDALRTVQREGRPALAVVATAGSTATGAFDDLAAIAELCREAGVWLHVDAAHGGSLLASPALRGRLSGIERADSVSWDPHKMLFMPISAGAVLVRDARHLDAAFRQSAPYLFHPRPGEVRSSDTGQRTLQCSRRLDALKLWVALRHYGLDHIARLQEHTVRMTARLHERLGQAPDFEPLHAPDCNILCFRHLPERMRSATEERQDAFQSELRERWNASGRGWITATVLRGRRALRVTIINPATGEADLEALIEGLRELGSEVETRQPPGGETARAGGGAGGPA
jgi:L-2,4-diaminobutyrate decarboxylase